MSTPLGLPGLGRPTFRSGHLDQVPAELSPLLDGALRVPTEYGGRGLSIPELTQTWVELAAADANLPQAFRGHFALAEDRLWQHGRAGDQRGWSARCVAGEIAGHAWSAVGSTTGSIFAEWAAVLVRRVMSVEEDDLAIATVDTRATGVTVVGDWDGFGHKGTGSGTTAFADVRVDPDHVLPFEDRFPFQMALYQLNLLATLVGIVLPVLAGRGLWQHPAPDAHASTTVVPFGAKGAAS